MEYRRVKFVGGCYFFTVVLAERGSDLLVRHIDDLRIAFKTVKIKHPFEIDAIVVLPDHLHCLWTLPTGDTARRLGCQPQHPIVQRREFRTLLVSMADFALADKWNVGVSTPTYKLLHL